MPTFYRIVVSNPPTRSDFVPQGQLGKRIRPDAPPKVIESFFNAISVFDNERSARSLARSVPRLGGFIAELNIPDGLAVEFEQFGDDPHHFDLRGEADVLLATIGRVMPV